jgi:methylated-DNA-protein-cysteine methyltransferase-like protein
MLDNSHQEFFKNVYEVVQLIPAGRVTTYGAIAAYLGLKRSARMVGWALHEIKHQAHIPAHRVVNRQGLLTGKQHFAANLSMEERLQQEGIQIVNNQVQQFEKVFWSPEELEIELNVE